MQFNKVEENIMMLFFTLTEGRKKKKKNSPKKLYPLKRKEDKFWMPRGKEN